MSHLLSFKSHIVAVINAGDDLGKACSLCFSKLGAKVVIYDKDTTAALAIVQQIHEDGGIAIAHSYSESDGQAIVQTALESFGGITILVYNTGWTKDGSRFEAMSGQEFDNVQKTQIKGAFTCAKAAWPQFRKQKFGCIINTSTMAGVYGKPFQENYSTAHMGIIGFTKTLAEEGAKFGIKAGVIIPVQNKSRNMQTDLIAAFIAAASHPNGPSISGKIFEVSSTHAAEIRWERSKGAVFRTGDDYTPSAVKSRWSELTNFTNPDYPETVADVDIQSHISLALHLPPLPRNDTIRYDGQTVVVTAAGSGLGRAYALMFGRFGANVVVHDVGSGAQEVARDIIKAGGKAAPISCPTEDGNAIVNCAMQNFGGVHVLVANERFMRICSFGRILDDDWDAVVDLNITGCFQCIKAVWPIFQKQNYGRIVTACSANGLYGNSGSASYSTAKAAVLGLTCALALEGRPYDILVNAIAPSVGPTITSTQQEMRDLLKSENFAPMVGYLASPDNVETTGSVFEVLGAWAAHTRWQRSIGRVFHEHPTPEVIISSWTQITKFDEGLAMNPTSVANETRVKATL